jgi:hypothetical protein
MNRWSAVYLFAGVLLATSLVVRLAEAACVGGMYCNVNHSCTGTDPCPTLVNGQQNPYPCYICNCVFDPNLVATVENCDSGSGICCPGISSALNACGGTCSPYGGPSTSCATWYRLCSYCVPGGERSHLPFRPSNRV